MGNDMLELARNMAKFAQKTQAKPDGTLGLRFFIATAQSPAANGKIAVQKPFDSTVLTLPCVPSAAAVLAAGDACFVLVPGSLSNAIVLGKADLQNL